MVRSSSPSRRPLAATVLLSIAALLGAGCETTAPTARSSGSAGTTAAAPQPPPLKVGMTAEQVRAAWGEPSEIVPLENAPKPGETWRYRQVLRSTDRQVAATVEEVPFFDPLTGAYRPQKEIRQSQETISIVQVTELIMLEGQLVGWKRSLNEERAFP